MRLPPPLYLQETFRGRCLTPPPAKGADLGVSVQIRAFLVAAAGIGAANGSCWSGGLRPRSWVECRHVERHCRFFGNRTRHGYRPRMRRPSRRHPATDRGIPSGGRDRAFRSGARQNRTGPARAQDIHDGQGAKHSRQWAEYRCARPIISRSPHPACTAQPVHTKYMIRQRRPPSQSWRTFLRNHAEAIAAIDLCVVPTVRFERLFAFVIISHGRRRLLWFAVTRHPTAEWLAQQIVEALPWDDADLGHSEQ